MKPHAPRGTRDVLPPESEAWQRLMDVAREAFWLHGYREIVLPVMEHTELFIRGIGENTDIVSKEMFTFRDKGGRSLTLRPEATAGVVRAFIEHGLGEKGLPVKLYYCGPMFRHERPQAGRYRQFHQLGAEHLGSAHPLADLEIISLCFRILEKLGLRGLDLVVNSVGDRVCRPAYQDGLRSFLAGGADQLCDDCRRRMEASPLRVFDCKREECRETLRGAPRISEYLCPDCREHLRLLRDYLKAAGIDFRLEPELVRGLDYYTRTVFEFQVPGEGAQNALAAGGRYDELVASLGGKDTPAVGFSLGVERVVLRLDPVKKEKKGIYIVSKDGKPKLRALELLRESHHRGFPAEMDTLGRSLKAQMKAADRASRPLAVIIGEEELEGGFLTLRDMCSSAQERVTEEELWRRLEKASRPDGGKY